MEIKRNSLMNIEKILIMKIKNNLPISTFEFTVENDNKYYIEKISIVMNNSIDCLGGGLI